MNVYKICDSVNIVLHNLFYLFRDIAMYKYFGLKRNLFPFAFPIKTGRHSVFLLRGEQCSKLRVRV